MYGIQVHKGRWPIQLPLSVSSRRVCNCVYHPRGMIYLWEAFQEIDNSAPLKNLCGSKFQGSWRRGRVWSTVSQKVTCLATYELWTKFSASQGIATNLACACFGLWSRRNSSESFIVRSQLKDQPEQGGY